MANSIDLVEWAIDLLMFQVKVERQIRVSSASTTVSKSGKASKLKSRGKGHPASNPLIIVPESLNEDDADKVIIQNLSTEMSAVIETSQRSRLAEDDGNIFSTPVQNKDMNWLDLQDIRQLEGLVRGHVVLAMMVGEGSKEFTDHLIKAFYSVSRMLWQGIENGMHAIKEIGKQNTNGEANAVGADKAKKSVVADTGPGTKKGPGAGAAAAGGGKNSKNMKTETGASGYLPQNLDQWSTFEVNEDISNAW